MPLFHTGNSRSPIDRVTEGIRQYWKLEEMLPKKERSTVQKWFSSTNYMWMCRCGFVDLDHPRNTRVRRTSKWFQTEVFDMKSNTSFDVQVGIVRKSGKEIVSKTAVLSPEPEKYNAVIRLIRRSELRKRMQSYKELELFVMIDGRNEEREDKNAFYIQKLRTDYKELLLSGRNSDFTIHVKHVKFEVHKSILGARSAVFSAMLEHDMQEKRSGEVTLMDAVDPVVFREFLLYLYTGEEEHLDWKNVVEFYKLADKYWVEDLRQLSVERMKAHISTENFCKVFPISQQLQNTELSEIVIQFFIEDSNEIVESEKYDEFVKEYPEETRVLTKILEAIK